MKIALVHRVFHTTGGTERYGLDLARALRDAGDDVHLFGTKAPVMPSVAFHGVKTTPGTRAMKLRSFMTGSERAVRLEVLESGRKFDAILGLGRTLEQDVLRVGGGCHAEYLETVRGWRNGERPEGLRAGAYDRAVLELERLQMSLERTRHVIAVSDRVRGELRRRYGMPDAAISVVHNGVDLERFCPERPELAGDLVRQTLDVPAEAFVVLFVGNGLVRKGFSTLLRAFFRFTVEVRARRLALGQLELWCVGRDPARQGRAVSGVQRLLAGLGAEVRLWGQRRDVERFYAGADVLVLPTRYEPFGNVCLEAMAMGLPVVTTRVNGASELFDSGLESLVLESWDAEEAVVRWLLVLSDVRARQRLGRAARQVATRHSIRRNGVAVREVLKEASGRPGARSVSGIGGAGRHGMW